jgi:thiamine biosynthesis lipoprotein
VTGLLRVEQLMGTAVRVQIADPLPGPELDRLAAAAFDWFRAVDARFSTYRADSEVSRVDRGELAVEAASGELRGALATCAQLWRETDGYFDVHAAGRLDPSGYVKGWSVQVASDRLVAAGAGNHCVDAGGDVRVRGRPAGEDAWHVGIRHPFDPLAVAWVLAATDLAVATSGTYERGPHVLDPRRGEPARHLCSVTVTGPDLGRADAYATAAVAMGEAGLAWLAALAGRTGYQSAAVTADGRAFRSEDLPVA